MNLRKVLDKLIELDDERIRHINHRDILIRLKKAYSENVRLQKSNGTKVQLVESSDLIRKIRGEWLVCLEKELRRVNSLLAETQ